MPISNTTINKIYKQLPNKTGSNNSTVEKTDIIDQKLNNADTNWYYDPTQKQPGQCQYG